MHIVFVSPFFVNNEREPLSGMPQYVYKIASLMQKRGHDVEIIAASSNNRTWKYKGININNALWFGTLKGSSVETSIGIIKREYAIQKKLREIDLKAPIDIVQYAGWSGTGFMHSLKCPAVLRLSTYSKVQYSHNESFKNYIEVYSFWERLAGIRSNGIIAPSKIIGETFGNDINRKVTIIETPYFNDVVENDKVYNDMLWNKRYLLFYGSFSKDKGFEVIGDMLLSFFRENSDLFFVCAGWDVKSKSGSAVQKLKKKLGEYKNRVIYMGMLNHQSLYPVIRHAECVLIPSLIDNLPNACLEALSLDKIVIGTYHTSLEQMICDGENGFLSEPGNAMSLLSAVKKVFDLSQEQREMMSIKNRCLIKKYDPTVAVIKLERYYNCLIERITR